jgi:hypothetical protein
MSSARSGPHLAQERALATLMSTRPATEAWRVHAHYLREIVGYHARHEQARLMPVLRDASRLLRKGS